MLFLIIETENVGLFGKERENKKIMGAPNQMLFALLCIFSLKIQVSTKEIKKNTQQNFFPLYFFFAASKHRFLRLPGAAH